MRLISNAVGVGGAFAAGASALILLVAGAFGGTERFLLALAVAIAVGSLLGAIGVLLVIAHDIRWEPAALFRGLAFAIGGVALVLSRGYRCELECTLPYAAAIAPVVALVLLVRRDRSWQDAVALLLGGIALLAATAQPAHTPCPWNECAPELFTYEMPCDSCGVTKLVTR